MKHLLTRMVQWSQELLAEVVQSGDLVVDLTVGTGQDTSALLQMVGEQGQVVGFDIQPQALLATRERMIAAGAQVRLQQQNIQPLQREAGIDLLQMSHAGFSAVMPAAPKGIIANLGYLPGGDQQLVTRPETTVAALEQGCSVLASGGRMTVVIYPAHPGGAEEGNAVSELFAGLQDPGFQVLRLDVSNRPAAPFVFVLEKTD
ncbi:MAG: methyltransferase domain-containing protein [Desulfuromusa sp.]|nr:methyltransferase domain-containing protein [Desulfuromusa sp.]